ncbi:hypothetical protein TcG_13245 [Trypanosoma cruzi]|nr:hypothetical protein TcG_13245 [Trypanosoma cruzi]
MQVFALLVMPRVCHDTSLRRARGAIDRAILLGTTALFRGVIRLCGGSVEGEDVDGPRSPDRCALFFWTPQTNCCSPFACFTGPGDFLRSGAAAWTVKPLRRPWLRGISCGFFLRFRNTVRKRTFHASSTSTRVNGGIAVVGSHFTRVCTR